jgi:hypothetical protein
MREAVKSSWPPPKIEIEFEASKHDAVLKDVAKGCFFVYLFASTFFLVQTSIASTLMRLAQPSCVSICTFVPVEQTHARAHAHARPYTNILSLSLSRYFLASL